ncbi:MAG: ComEC/Rec2 family competence protein [Simkaniaceae bacterium]|nr:ComEC/Rec2 family competence protein [Simkaniaceae bacterium]
MIWDRFPALHFGLSITIGIIYAMTGNLLSLLAGIPLLKKPLACLIIPLATLYTYYLAPPSIYDGPLDFQITSVRPYSTPFSKGYLYTGTVPSIGKATYYSKKYFPADSDYHFHLAHYEEGFIKGSTPTPIQDTHSSAGRRFKAKKKVKNLIFKHYSSPKVAFFLSGLATGNLENRLLKFQFLKVGLAHLLAISGFHFALLATFIALFLKPHLREKTIATLLLILLSSYFFFIGPSPSVSRAYLAALLLLFGRLLDLNASPLNSLGVALSLSLLFDPSIAKELGFQLSFIATAGILLFTKPLEEKLEFLLPKRRKAELLLMPRTHQVGYHLLRPLRKGLALLLAVHLVTLPVLLSSFGSFPLLGLLYNLFYPPLVSLSLFLLLLSFLIPPLHLINQWYTSFILIPIEYPPLFFDYTLHFSLPPLVTILLLSMIFTFGLTKRGHSLHNIQ